jgi:hypothetical protein
VERGADADAMSVHVVLGVTAVVVSLFGYFLCIIVAFSAITALLIGLSNVSTVKDVLHYPRPIFDRAAIVPDSEVWQTPNGSVKEEAPVKEPASDKRDSGATAVAKMDEPKHNLETKRNPQKLAHLQKPKPPARPRERRDRGYAVAFGNTEGSGYRPGLDAQR